MVRFNSDLCMQTSFTWTHQALHFGLDSIDEWNEMIKPLRLIRVLFILIIMRVYIKDSWLMQSRLPRLPLKDILSHKLLKKWDSCFIPAGHELAPGRAAERLHIIILQFDSLRCQPVQRRGLDLGAMVPNVPEALIIHEDENDMRLRARLVKFIFSVPVFPRHLNAPRLSDDEAEE